MKILLLEDDAILSDLITTALEEQAYQVSSFEDGKKALEAVEKDVFDMLICDINVPSMSGLELLSELRSFNIQTPTIIITAYQDTEYLKKSFSKGCDDYIKKPFHLEELLERVKNLAKRYKLDKKERITIGNITLDMEKNSIVKENKTYNISHKEAQILHYLFIHKKRVVSFDELIQNIWYYDEHPDNTTIRVYIKNIRKIIGDEKIKTIRKVGYILE